MALYAVNGTIQQRKAKGVNTFDKLCAASAFVLGIVFLILGALGLLFGCKAHFTLPPILGGLPALVGWGITKSVYTAWNANRPDQDSGNAGPMSP